AGVARRHPAQAAKVLSRTVALRRALYGLFKNALDGSQPAPAYLDVLSRELAIARQHQKLSPADRRFHWKWDRPQRALDCILWRVCQSAADLLTSSELSQVRRCGGPDCGWMFLDTSRNHSRRWCDMQDCGNLVKVRRFRERSAKAYSLASKRRQTASKT
ncbi:MAG TPA: CGNR zinc finger domain-containing protein, partial [Bryobacteraceae bacterium]|nr:CGNR zinc finger domain-containing protein [Bryobacteraceae bacterium]